MLNIKLLFISFISISSIVQEGEWKKSLDKDGIIIYTRKLENLRFDEFLAETTINGTVEDFKAHITDIDDYSEWLSDCKSAEIIERPDKNTILYHMQVKVPFPFENRDIVQQIQLIETADKLEVLITNHPDKFPAEDKFIRMEEAYGSWKLEQINENEVSITFQYYADPSGDIPAWLVNSFIVKSPHESVKNLRDMMD